MVSLTRLTSTQSLHHSHILLLILSPTQPLHSIQQCLQYSTNHPTLQCLPLYNAFHSAMPSVRTQPTRSMTHRRGVPGGGDGPNTAGNLKAGPLLQPGRLSPPLSEGCDPRRPGGMSYVRVHLITQVYMCVCVTVMHAEREQA